MNVSFQKNSGLTFERVMNIPGHLCQIHGKNFKKSLLNVGGFMCRSYVFIRAVVSQACMFHDFKPPYCPHEASRLLE